MNKMNRDVIKHSNPILNNMKSSLRDVNKNHAPQPAAGAREKPGFFKSLMSLNFRRKEGKAGHFGTWRGESSSKSKASRPTVKRRNSFSGSTLFGVSSSKSGYEEESPIYNDPTSVCTQDLPMSLHQRVKDPGRAPFEDVSRLNPDEISNHKDMVSIKKGISKDYSKDIISPVDKNYSYPNKTLTKLQGSDYSGASTQHNGMAASSLVPGYFDHSGCRHCSPTHSKHHRDSVEQNSISSGYGSADSRRDAASLETVEGVYEQLPCMLEKSQTPFIKTQTEDLPPPLPKRNYVQLDSRHSRNHGIDPVKLNRTGVPLTEISHSRSASEVGGAQLVKVLSLEKFMRNKWISGVAVSKNNEYIVVDQRDALILCDNGTLKKCVGSKGSNRLREPLDVTVMSNGNLVFSDHLDQDVKIYNSRGQFLRKVKDPSLTNIAGVATNNRREVLIAGTDKQWISVHSEDDNMLYTIPSVKDKKAPFEHPYSVAVSPLTGDIIVGDDSRQLVVAVAPDNGRVLWRFCPTTDNRHFFPSSICVDCNGYIFVADLYNEKIYMLDTTGRYLKTILSRGEGLKGGPGAIATDNRGHILVADEEKTLKVFRYGNDKGFIISRRTSRCLD